jgi:hypothetical protein
LAKKVNIEDYEELKEKIEISLLQQARIMQQNDEIIRLLRAGHSMPAAAEKIYTTEDVMDKLHISRRKLLSLKQTGKIRFKQEGRTIRYLQSHIDEFMMRKDN